VRFRVSPTLFRAEFYASRFRAANDVIGKYLEGGGGQHVGAAHFFLGASLLSQAILADPKNAANSDKLRNQALEQFVQAKQLHTCLCSRQCPQRFLRNGLRRAIRNDRPEGFSTSSIEAVVMTGIPSGRPISVRIGRVGEL
jgi:hypothetical protein